jgi:phosphoesterase RecJ-like protein
MTRPSPVGEICTVVKSSSSFVLTTHINPDADGLGSECALAIGLTHLGKNVRIINSSTTPANCRFLSDLFPIETYDPGRHADVVHHADALILLDANQPGRLAAMSNAWSSSSARKVCIEPDDVADVIWLDTASAATGLLIYDFLFSALHVPITREIATALYAAIMTDTGSFRFPKTNGRVHAVTAALLDAGADPVRVYEEVYEKGSPGRMQLLGRMLSDLTLAHKGRVAWVWLTEEMFSSTGTTEVDTDAFVSYPLQIDGIQIGLMFTELPGLIKVNFRSKGSVPVNLLAKEFGGNGHLNAAGARIPDAVLNELIPRVVARAEAYLQ